MFISCFNDMFDNYIEKIMGANESYYVIVQGVDCAYLVPFSNVSSFYWIIDSGTLAQRVATVWIGKGSSQRQNTCINKPSTRTIAKENMR